MQSICEKRAENLRNILDSKEALLIVNEVNIGYITGFFHSEGYCLITPSRTVFFVDFRYIEAAQKNSVGCEVVCYKKLIDDIASIAKADGIKNIVFETSYITVERKKLFSSGFEKHGIEFTADSKLDKAICDIRIIKDESEILKIQTAQNIAEKAYLETLNYVKPGVSEREIAAKMEFLMKMSGAERVSFDLITITGKKTSLPHGVPSDDLIQSGDFFTCDFGAVYEGYHSDTTRTVAVGSATDEMKEIYDIVLNAQLTALEKIKPEVKCSEIDAAARDIIDSAGYGKYFGHSTGHGVGLDIHEAPTVSKRSEIILKQGMIITDEPGIYLPNKFGVRIEDMVLVTENGYKNFVNLTKELIIL